MKRLIALSLIMIACAASAQAKGNVPDCRLGRAPVNVDRKPAPGEQKFTAPKGAVVHMEYRSPGQQRLTYVRCKFASDVESWAMSPSRAWDVPSGNDYTPEGWDIPYELPAGPQGPPGPQGPQGPQGPPGETRIITDDGIRRAAAEYKESPPLRTDFALIPDWCEESTGHAIVCVAVVAGIGTAAYHALNRNDKGCSYCTY